MFKELTLLYVEDEKVLQNTVKRSLQILFETILTAQNGQEGLELFKEKQSSIDIVITDINMPYMNGLEMCEHIRQLDKNIPIIITTAFNDLDFLHKAIELDVAHFVLKPIIMPKLMEAIKNSVEPKILSKKLEVEQKINEEEKIKNAKLIAIKKLTSGITHELNTPLTYIKGALEIMYYDIENIKENDSTKKILFKNLDHANDGLKRIENIVNTMKDLYDDISVEEKTETNIYETVVDALILAFSKSKHISNIYINGELFDLDLDKDKLTFQANVQKGRIEHLWVILINNALDELQKIQDFSDRKIDITIEENTEYIIVKIQDNAGGISEDIMDHIYEPFKGTKPSSGMGIGLTIAHKIIEENDSYINASSQNNGALFEVGIKKTN